MKSMKFADVLKEVFGEEALKTIDIITTDDVLHNCGLQLTMESQWKQSGFKDWCYRIDPENPNIPLQRHIHIAREKHIATKNMQASWNIDGSRHDRSSFNSKVGDDKTVREIVRNVLGIKPEITLEHYKDCNNKSLLEHRINNIPNLIEEEISNSHSGEHALVDINLCKSFPDVKD